MTSLRLIGKTSNSAIGKTYWAEVESKIGLDIELYTKKMESKLYIVDENGFVLPHQPSWCDTVHKKRKTNYSTFKTYLKNNGT